MSTSTSTRKNIAFRKEITMANSFLLRDTFPLFLWVRWLNDAFARFKCSMYFQEKPEARSTVDGWKRCTRTWCQAALAPAHLQPQSTSFIPSTATATPPTVEQVSLL